MIKTSGEKFIIRARELVANDKRNSLERGARKRPKSDFLKVISEVIVLLMDNLYSISDQLHLINSIDKKFDVTNTTYSLFLKEYLKKDFEVFKKNRLFAANTHRIKEAVKTYPTSSKLQFSLAFGESRDVSLDDYIYFMNTYYLKFEGEFFEAYPIKRVAKTKRSPVLSSDGKTYTPGFVVVEPADTLNDVAPKLQTIKGKEVSLVEKLKNSDARSADNQVASIFPKKHDKESVSLGNSNDVIKIYKTHKERDELKDKHGDFKIGLIENSDINKSQQIFRVILNKEEIPKEARVGNFLFADYNDSKMTLNEPYIFLKDIDLVHYADPNTYGLMNGLLFVCDTIYKGRTGYDLYRYYEGNIYFIETLKFPMGNVSFQRDVTQWYNDNVSGDFFEFAKDFLAKIGR